MDQQRLAGLPGVVRAFQREPQVLPAPDGRAEASPTQARCQVDGAARVPTHGAIAQHLDTGDRPVQYVVGETAPDGLDLGQLRHAPSGPRAPSGPPMPVAGHARRGRPRPARRRCSSA